MLQNELDKLLSISIKQNLKEKELDNLERNVWNDINRRKKNKNNSWLDRTLETMSIWQFQLASLAFAIFFGLSIALTIPLKKEYFKHHNSINFEAFSSTSPYLLSTKLALYHEKKIH